MSSASSAAPLPCPALRYQPLIPVAVAAGVGILVDRWRPLSVAAWWLLAIVSLSVWLILWRRHWERWATVLLLMAVASTAGGWHHCRWFLFAADDLANFAREEPQPVCLEALADGAARQTPAPPDDPLRAVQPGDRTRVALHVVGVRNGVDWRPAAGTVELYVHGRIADVAAGDRLRIFGKLATPGPALNPGQFDYAHYLRGERIRCYVRAEHPAGISVVQQAGWGPSRWIDSARNAGSRLLERAIGPQRNPLAAAVLLGAREQLDPERTETFVETGSIHLLVIAGIHVGVLAGVLWFLASRLCPWRAAAMTIVAVAIVGYMLLVHAQPPVVRATILVLAGLVALATHRVRAAGNALAAGALVVLAINPADLFNVGAQLSFLAVAALIGFGRRWYDDPDPEAHQLQQLIEAAYSWPVRQVRWLGRAARELFLVGGTIWLVVLPLVMARFHLITWVGPLLNVVLWVPMEIAMVSGFALLVLGPISPLAALAGRVCDASLHVMEWLVQVAQRVPGGHVWVPGPPDWWLAGLYTGLALAAVLPAWRPPRRWCLAALASWITLGFLATGLGRAHDRLQCTILAVDHGCATLVEFPSGQTLLYDAGQMGAPMSGTRIIAGALWERNLTHVDAVVLSHADIDHYNALPGLLDRFSVGVVYVSPTMFEVCTPPLDALQTAIRQAGVPIREIRAGDRLRTGSDSTVEVLHPPPHGVIGTTNANSVVLAVSHREQKILLPGDLESPGLDYLLAEEPTHCQVLLAPHHGSRRSNSPKLVGWCRPDWVVISGGYARDFHEIEQTYRDQGCRFFHTAVHGAVSVKIDAQGLSIQGHVPR